MSCQSIPGRQSFDGFTVWSAPEREAEWKSRNKKSFWDV
ncbi:unnamed protein product, partial [Staurois parvus]